MSLDAISLTRSHGLRTCVTAEYRAEVEIDSRLSEFTFISTKLY